MKFSNVHWLFCEVQKLLTRPTRVLVLCLLMVFVSLVWEGSFWQLWNLKRESARLQNKMSEVAKLSQQLNMKIEKASDLTYIDQQARDRFDLVGKDDLIFIFSDQRDSNDASQH
ncbi:MAG: septum formation initiator family protein [Bdellovibrionales bacterium]|nr:septum formation initiator family protein [Bdellovibrionales bacterium]